MAKVREAIYRYIEFFVYVEEPSVHFARLLRLLYNT